MAPIVIKDGKAVSGQSQQKASSGGLSDLQKAGLVLVVALIGPAILLQFWEKVNGQFRRCALELQRDFPGLKIEGGPFTPSASVQYAIRAVRVGQIAVGVFFFFGEQILGKLGRPPFDFMNEVPSNMMVHAGALYGLNCIVQTLKSINAFEVTYNGEVVYSKLESGSFPESGELSKKLQSVKKAANGNRGA